MSKPTQIHIVGVSPRTGTTLMAEAMATCFGIQYANRERRVFSAPPLRIRCLSEQGARGHHDCGANSSH